MKSKKKRNGNYSHSYNMPYHRHSSGCYQCYQRRAANETQSGYNIS